MCDAISGEKKRIREREEVIREAQKSDQNTALEEDGVKVHFNFEFILDSADSPALTIVQTS